jgi:hypothetical protein
MNFDHQGDRTPNKDFTLNVLAVEARCLSPFFGETFKKRDNSNALIEIEETLIIEKTISVLAISPH